MYNSKQLVEKNVWICVSYHGTIFHIGLGDIRYMTEMEAKSIAENSSVGGNRYWTAKKVKLTLTLLD